MKGPESFHGCFVTGTDTGVGKTLVSAALLHRLRLAGWVTAGFKPVAAGATVINGERINEDVRALREASSAVVTDGDVGPFQFDTPCAPHIAAALEGRVIDKQAVLQTARSVQRRADFMVVEGVGGFCVPLGPDWDTAHIACAMGLPVVLVVGLRLGCLNHALLTAEAIRARYLRLAGWVANTIDPAMPMRDENVSTLCHELGHRYQAPCVGVIPWLDTPSSENVSRHLDDAALRSALDPHGSLPIPLARRTA